MIKTLSQSQINKFPEYVKLWTEKGLTTKPKSLENAIIDFSLFQKNILKKPVAPVVILDSPLKCWIAVNTVKSLFNNSREQIKSQVRPQVWSQVYSQVSSQVESQVYSRVWSQVREQVNSQVREQVNSQVWSQVNSQVWSQVESQVDSQVYSQVREQVRLNMQEFTFVYPYFDCQFWAGWFSFYEFFRNECGINYPPEYDTFKNCQDYGMVFPLDELCIVCQPPTIIKKNNSGLHCENGPALSYNGDNEIYALNGVVMKKEYVMTPSHEISGEMILKETNTEVRRELLRKVGVERAMNSLPHKLLEKRGNYELYSIDLSNEVKDARYLKMLNPSVGVWHIEGISPGISTIADALKWRNNNWYEDAEILT